MTQRVLFVLASAGDEATFVGATIAQLGFFNAEQSLLLCTPPGELLPEFARSREVLGIGDYRVLGSRAARWPGLEPREYLSGTAAESSSTLVGAELGEVASDIGAVILELQPDVVVSYGQTGLDPARRRVHDAARWATEVLRTPFYVIGGTPARSGVRVDAEASMALKRAGVGAYAAKAPTSKPGAEGEVLARLHPESRSALSSPARVIWYLAAFILGLLSGGLLTVVHQTSSLVAGITVPWGVILALAVTVAAVTGLRLIHGTRIVAGVAALGFLVATGLLALGSPGGSVLIPNNAIGVVWTIGSVLIIAVVLAWPRLGGSGSARIKASAVKGSDHP